LLTYGTILAVLSFRCVMAHGDHVMIVSPAMIDG
jgi:hypothetical protein